MIGLCQEGKNSPDALGRSAGISFSNLSARSVASRQWLPFDGEPDFHLLAQFFLAAQKIEFVFSCQSRNLSTGASGAYAPLPSRLIARPGRRRAE